MAHMANADAVHRVIAAAVLNLDDVMPVGAPIPRETTETLERTRTELRLSADSRDGPNPLDAAHE